MNYHSGVASENGQNRTLTLRERLRAARRAATRARACRTCLVCGALRRSGAEETCASRAPSGRNARHGARAAERQGMAPVARARRATHPKRLRHPLRPCPCSQGSSKRCRHRSVGSSWICCRGGRRNGSCRCSRIRLTEQIRYVQDLNVQYSFVIQTLDHGGPPWKWTDRRHTTCGWPGV